MDEDVSKLAAMDGFSFNSIAKSDFIQRILHSQRGKYDKLQPTSANGVRNMAICADDTGLLKAEYSLECLVNKLNIVGNLLALNLRERLMHRYNKRRNVETLALLRYLHNPRKFKDVIPDTWSPMEDEELIKIVPVTSGSEYDDIQATFRQNLPSYHIIKIERIQNKTLYQEYQALKRKYEAENPNISNEVDSLWHGTAEGSVDGINKSGFNRSYCGKNATIFGEGVYFTKDIKYSAGDTYSTPDHQGKKRLYKCSVLAGKVMQGYPGLKVLQESYNSAVENTQRRNIYVTFDDSQAYPNYLITFSKLKLRPL
ncbi:protein mono-ADP-ribosyltransferase PARP14-like [Octopus vulgaris]|uniref:Poly [ADP-ribose] polymerase n=1 Tax=Octopus vulgaris TaxID=6645 RepID=A0AA36EX96_OCTVU|nr:protein mono-ADP-ribosyltransferase PARP14-like [Octopus vulgaris]